MTIEKRETILRVGIPRATRMGEPVLIRLRRTNGGSVEETAEAAEVVANGSQDNIC